MKLALSALCTTLVLIACNSDEETAAASTVPVDTQARDCLALSMYFEARGEGRMGMLAVGSVVLNRVEDERFPDDACSVIRQGGETPPCQFSWWCDGKSDRPKQGRLWNQSNDIAYELLTNRVDDPTKGALYFHRDSIDPDWDMERTVSIGRHIFYR